MLDCDIDLRSLPGLIIVVEHLEKLSLNDAVFGQLVKPMLECFADLGMVVEEKYVPNYLKNVYNAIVTCLSTQAVTACAELGELGELIFTTMFLGDTKVGRQWNV